MGVNYYLIASQEINLLKGTSQNDKAIFESITGLMKAQSYEFNALKDKKKKPAIYSFHLIIAVDAELYKMEFMGAAESVVEKINEENFVYNYIVNRSNTSAQIRFAHKSVIPKVIAKYTELHDLSIGFVTRLYSEFYDGLLKDHNKYRWLLPDFVDRVKYAVRYAANINDYIKEEQVSFQFNSDNELMVSISYDDEKITQLIQSALAVTTIKNALKSIYNYEGKFTIISDDEPPF